jgi:RND family efflux transporter MFP subunit
VTSRAATLLVTLAVAAALGLLATWDPVLARRLGDEDGLLEWAQVGLVVATAFIAARDARWLARAGRPAVLEVVIVALMAYAVISEVDPDRRLFGTKVIITSFFVNPRHALGWRILAFVVVVGAPLAFGVWVWRRRAALWAGLRRLPGEPWGQILLAGAAVAALTEAFEKRLDRLPGFPPNYVEETLELIAAVCFFVALLARPRPARAMMEAMPPRLPLVLLLTGALLTGCTGEPTPSVAQETPRASPPPRPVRVAAAATEQVARTVVSTGTLAAQDQVVLGAKVAGRLAEIRVDLGSRVRRGDVIARLDQSDFKVRVEQAEAALQQARARLGLPAGGADEGIDPERTAIVRQARAVLEEARLTRDRSERLLRQDLIARAQLDTAIANLQVAEGRYQDALEEVRNRQAVLAQRRAELEEARQRLADTALVSPIDGAVSQRQAAVGEYLTAGAPVATLVQVHPLRLRVAVPEREAADVRVGQPVRLSVEGDTTVYAGRVVRLSPIVHEQNRTLTVEAEVPNERGALRPGAFARAEIVTQAAQPVVTVPATSIIVFAGVEKVLLVRDGKTVERRVQTGRRLGQGVEIVDGLKGGEAVVREPGSLTGGQPVAVAP